MNDRFLTCLPARVIALLGVIALLTASLPVGAATSGTDPGSIDSCCAEAPDASSTACATLAGATSAGATSACATSAGATAIPEDSDCCQSGCDSCFLRCCTGLISLVPAPVTVRVSPLAAPVVSPLTGYRSPAQDRAIEHPPKS